MRAIRPSLLIAVMKVHRVGAAEAQRFLNAPGDQPFNFSTGEVYVRPLCGKPQE